MVAPVWWKPKLGMEWVEFSMSKPKKYDGPYTAPRAPGHNIMSIDLFVIAQQPECCPHSKTFCYQHAILSPVLDCMCEDQG